MTRPTAEISPQLYNNSDARNWLTIHGCTLSPTKLGRLEVVFPSDQALVDFSLRWSSLIYRVCAQSTT